MVGDGAARATRRTLVAAIAARVATGRELMRVHARSFGSHYPHESRATLGEPEHATTADI